jgi:hypothetical protein
LSAIDIHAPTPLLLFEIIHNRDASGSCAKPCTTLVSLSGALSFPRLCRLHCGSDSQGPTRPMSRRDKQDTGQI